MIVRFFPEQNGLVGIVVESELNGGLVAYGQAPIDHLVNNGTFQTCMVALKNVGR